MQNLSLLKTSEDQQLKSNVFKEITSCCRYSVFKTWGHQHVCGCSSFTFHYWRGVRTANYFLRVPTYFQKHTGQFEHRTCLGTKNISVWVKKKTSWKTLKRHVFVSEWMQCNAMISYSRWQKTSRKWRTPAENKVGPLRQHTQTHFWELRTRGGVDKGTGTRHFT